MASRSRCGFVLYSSLKNPQTRLSDQQGNPIRTDQGVGAELIFGYLQQFNYAFVRLETWIQKADTTQDEILRYVKGLIRIETKVDFIVEKTTRMQRDLEAIRNRQSELLAVGVQEPKDKGFRSILFERVSAIEINRLRDSLGGRSLINLQKQFVAQPYASQPSNTKSKW
jgi:hypothetical protein